MVGNPEAAAVVMGNPEAAAVVVNNLEAAAVVVDNPEAAAEVVGNREAVVVVVDNHGVVGGIHEVAALVDIQLKGDRADLTETFVAQVALTLGVVQIFHLFYPFQPCAVSAYSYKPCSKQCPTSSSEAEKHLEFLHFQ